MAPVDDRPAGASLSPACRVRLGDIGANGGVPGGPLPAPHDASLAQLLSGGGRGGVARPRGPPGARGISATIGPGRGLEDVFGALPRVGSRVALHLYGGVANGQEGWLERHLARVRERTEVVVHPLQPANAMLAALAHHQIGLSLDGGDCLNRSLTVGNKFFLYLQAGLACIATDTAGHRSVFPPEARYGGTYRSGDVAQLASVVEALANPSALAAAQRAAWIAGRTTYVWDREKPLFLEAVAGALAGAPRRPSTATVSVGGP